MFQLANCALLNVNPLRPIPVGDPAPGFESDAVRLVSTMRDWKLATSSKRCMLFVSGDWHLEAAMLRKPYSGFAEWNRKNSDMQTIVVDITKGREHVLYDTIQDIRPTPLAGVRHYGSGLVVWFEDGRVVDCEGCVQLLSIEKLKSRTAAAYSSFW